MLSISRMEKVNSFARLPNGIQIPNEIKSEESFIDYVINQCHQRKKEVMQEMKLKKPGSVISPIELFEYCQALKDFLDFDLIHTKFLSDFFVCPEDYKIRLIEAKVITLRTVPRMNKVELYKSKIKESDFIPPVILSGNYDMIDGHHRATASIELGYNVIPAFVVSGCDQINCKNEVVF